MGYTNKQIDPPKIYCLICMHRCRATKTLATTLYAQKQSHQNFCCNFCTMQSHQNFHCDWNKQLMCKCKDKTSKTTLKHNQCKTLKTQRSNCSINFTKFTIVLTHSTNFLPEFYLVAEVGGEERNRFLVILHESLRKFPGEHLLLPFYAHVTIPSIFAPFWNSNQLQPV